MFKSLGDLLIKLGLDSSALDRGLQNSGKNLDKFKNNAVQSFKNAETAAISLKGAITAIGSAAAVGFIMNAVKAYMDAEASVVKLGVALKATGRYSQEAMGQIQGAAAQISKATTFDDDDIVAATATFAQFAKGLNSSQLASGQKLIVGLAHTMQIDLRMAAMQAGKAVSGASDTIGRSGIKLKDTKDQAVRLAEALDKTKAMYAGAEGASQSLEGKAQQLEVSWGNLLETIGQTVTAAAGAQGGLDSLRNKVIDTDNAIKNNQYTIAMWIKVIGFFLIGVTKVGLAVGAIAAGILTGIEGVVINSFAAVGDAINGILKILTNGVNKAISLANKVPGVNLGGGFKAPQIDLKGIKGFGKMIQGNATFTSGTGFNILKSIGDDFNNLRAPVRFEPVIPKGGGGAFGVDDMGGDKEKKKKKAKTEKEKEEEKLKERAKQLAESVMTPWEKEAAAIKEATDMLNKKRISYETYSRLVKQAHDEAAKSVDLSKLDTEAQVKKYLVDPWTKALDKKQEEFDATVDQVKAANEALQAIQTPAQQYAAKLAVINKNLTDGVYTQEEANRLIKAAKDEAYQPILTPLEQYNKKIAELNDLLKEGVIDQAEHTKAVKDAQKELKEATSKTADEINGYFANIGQRFEDAFMSLFSGEKFNPKQFFADILSGLARLIIQLTIIQPMLKYIKALVDSIFDPNRQIASAKSSGGGIWGIIGGIASSVITGALGGIGGGFKAPVGGTGQSFGTTRMFADGGNYQAGVPRIVGEKGPELEIPNTSGSIISNKDLKNGLTNSGSSTTLVQQFHIKANDAKGFKEMLAQQKTFIQRMSLEGVQQANNKRGRPGPLDKGRGAK